MNISVIFHDDNDARASHALYNADKRKTYILLQRRFVWHSFYSSEYD